MARRVRVAVGWRSMAFTHPVGIGDYNLGMPDKAMPSRQPLRRGPTVISSTSRVHEFNELRQLRHSFILRAAGRNRIPRSLGANKQVCSNLEVHVVIEQTRGHPIICRSPERVRDRRTASGAEVRTKACRSHIGRDVLMSGDPAKILRLYYDCRIRGGAPLFATKRAVALVNFGKITANLKLDLSAKTTASHGVPQKFADGAE